jgi:cysteine rich repeat protein
MNRMYPVFAFFFLFVGLSPSSAQTLSYADAIQQLASACGADVAKHCKGVELGGGKLKACLDSKPISAQCGQARTRVYESIARRVKAQRSITQICAPDILRLCGSVVPGDANILSCMMESSPSVISAACNRAFADTGWRTERVQQ